MRLRTAKKLVLAWATFSIGVNQIRLLLPALRRVNRHLHPASFPAGFIAEDCPMNPHYWPWFLRSARRNHSKVLAMLASFQDDFNQEGITHANDSASVGG